MRVGQRLFLAVMPAIVGLLTVAALAWFGEYARQAPEWLVLAALVASLGSAYLAWRNTRYVAQRVKELAGRRSEERTRSSLVRRAGALLEASLPSRHAERGESDELDRIEELVGQLSEALERSRLAQESAEELVRTRQREYERLVAQSVESAITRLEEVRLPLHILLENRFGELNDNQEEMIGAARAAAEAVDADLLGLRDVVRLDLGEMRLRPERVRVQDVVVSLLPPLRLTGEARGVAVTMEVAPTTPPISVDRRQMQSALASLCRELLQRTPDRGTFRLEVDHDRSHVQLRVSGFVGPCPEQPVVALPSRIVEAHGGTLAWQEGQLQLTLPVAGATRAAVSVGV